MRLWPVGILVLGMMVFGPACDGDDESETAVAVYNGSVAGAVTIQRSVRCGRGVADDCKGLLSVTALPCPDPATCGAKALGIATIDGADLSDGQAVDFDIGGLPEEGAVYLFAALYETADDAEDPRHGDLQSALPAGATVVSANAPATVDLNLSRLR